MTDDIEVLERQEALKILSGPYKIRGGSNEPTTTLYFDTRMVELFDALNMALDALRAQQETEKNEPLTLEQMRQFRKDNRPVWIKVLFTENQESGWALSGPRVAIEQNVIDTVLWYDNYGELWIAYERPPVKEET